MEAIIEKHELSEAEIMSQAKGTLHMIAKQEGFTDVNFLSYDHETPDQLFESGRLLDYPGNESIIPKEVADLLKKNDVKKVATLRFIDNKPESIIGFSARMPSSVGEEIQKLVPGFQVLDNRLGYTTLMIKNK
jgi:hypothetical protein